MSFGTSKSKSKPLTAEQVQSYWNTLNQNTGGRLASFATDGTPAVQYERLSPEELQAVGGLGATQVSEVERMRKRAIDELSADPSLTLQQRRRATQLTDEEAADRLASIAQQTEAEISRLGSGENERAFEAALANAKLTRDDLTALANIFFGGKGNVSKSSSFNAGL